MQSIDDGYTWTLTETTPDYDLRWWGLTYGKGIWVALAHSCGNDPCDIRVMISQ